MTQRVLLPETEFRQTIPVHPSWAAWETPLARSATATKEVQ